MRCAILGDPIDHSLSPVLHRAAYDALGLSEWSYEPRLVPAGTLAGFIARLGGDWRGLSVTMPLKREAFALASSMSHRARLVGGVNTLVRSGYGWAGDNTDLPGAVAAVRERTDVVPSAAVILGAGATAASTGLAMAELGARRITVLARDVSRAGQTVAVIAGHPTAPIVSALPLSGSAEADLLVSTIPASAQTPDLVARWGDVPVLFDVVYDPWPTPLMSAATGLTVTGLDLLVQQAVLQVELFTGMSAPLDRMRADAEQALGLAPAVLPTDPA